MSANSVGHLFKFTSFGESHGAAMGVVIEGVPSGLKVDLNLLNEFLMRRRPGLNPGTSARNENDDFEILSGVFQEKTLGTPIAIIVRNLDARSKDYDKIKKRSRPGHADDTWRDKFDHVDHRGGGRSSGRETLSRVIAGAFAKMLVTQLSPETKILAFPRSVGDMNFSDQQIQLSQTWCLKESARKDLEALLIQAQEEGKSYGGVAEINVNQAPSGLGQPVFRKIKSDLALMVMSLGAVQAFELGDGFSVVTEEGSEFHGSESQKKYGGIRGGITTGEPIIYRVAFKPTATVLDAAKQGRHDPCVLLRALVVLEAQTWIVLADHMLWKRLDNLT